MTDPLSILDSDSADDGPKDARTNGVVLPPTKRQRSEPQEDKVFRITLKKTDREKHLGVYLREMCVRGIDQGLVARWNDANPEQAVRVGDRISEVNNARRDMAALLEEVRAKDVLYMKLVRDKVFDITLKKTAEHKHLGVYLKEMRVQRICEGIVKRWNDANPEQFVRVGDRISEVNDVKDDPAALLEEVRKQDTLDLRLVRGGEEAGLVLVQRPTEEEVRNKMLQLFQAPAEEPVEEEAEGEEAGEEEELKASMKTREAQPPSPPLVSTARLKGFVAESESMQGRRDKQEDRRVKVTDFTKAAKALNMPIDHLDQPCGFFAVYDGHQGHLCSEFASRSLHFKLLQKLSAETRSAAWTDGVLCNVLREVCEELDQEFLSRFRTAPDGTTMVVNFITGTRLFTAWVGDSRCLLCRRTSQGKMAAVALTEDHKPSVRSEAERVKKSGGIVVKIDGACRVAHVGFEERWREVQSAQAQGLGVVGTLPVALAVSRSLGDRQFKAVSGPALLTATPSVRVLRLDPSHKFIALVCDGVTDVMSNEDVILELSRERGPSDPEASARVACGALVQQAFNRGSSDNLTAIFVRFLWEGAADSEDIGTANDSTTARSEAQIANDVRATDALTDKSLKRQQAEESASANAAKIAKGSKPSSSEADHEAAAAGARPRTAAPTTAKGGGEFPTLASLLRGGGVGGVPK